MSHIWILNDLVHWQSPSSSVVEHPMANLTSKRCAVSGFHKTRARCRLFKPVSKSFATANRDGSWNKQATINWRDAWNKAQTDTWCNVKFSFCFTSKYKAIWKENLVVNQMSLRAFFHVPLWLLLGLELKCPRASLFGLLICFKNIKFPWAPKCLNRTQPFQRDYLSQNYVICQLNLRIDRVKN